MVKLTDEQNENLKYINTSLDKLKEANLIDDVQVVEKPSRYGKNSILFHTNDGKPLEIETDLESKYRVVFDDYYEEWTDYLTVDSDFKSHVDWFMKFINAYVKQEYVEKVFKDSTTNEVVYRRLTFTNNNLGRKQLISYPPRFFFINHLAGKYKAVG